MLTLLISLFASIGAMLCAFAAAVCLRGHGVFLAHILMTLYRIALGEVAAIEMVLDDDDDHGAP